jgi:cytochrome c oxidase subunit 3
MHWALQSIKAREPVGMKAGLVLTLLMGLAFLLTQMLEYARIGFNPSDGAFGTIFFGLTGLHGAHVFVGLTLLSMATVRAFSRPLPRSTTTRSRSPESTGTSST